MRLRLVSFTITPVIVIEDDGNLAPGPNVTPVVVPAAQLDDVPTLVRDGLAQLQAQADAEQ